MLRLCHLRAQSRVRTSYTLRKDCLQLWSIIHLEVTKVQYITFLILVIFCASILLQVTYRQSSTCICLQTNSVLNLFVSYIDNTTRNTNRLNKLLTVCFFRQIYQNDVVGILNTTITDKYRLDKNRYLIGTHVRKLDEKDHRPEK